MAENTNTKKVLNIENILTVVLAFSILLCGTITYQVLVKGYATFGTISFFRVVTGSMEPTIPTGALLVCENIDIEDIVTGDIICFHSKDKYMKNSVITHRVYSVKKDGEGQTHLFTKGDANLSIDGYTTDKGNFIGKVKWYSEEGSFFIGIARTLSSKVGFLACVVFPVLLISSLVLNECTKSIMKDLEEASAELDRKEAQAAAAAQAESVTDEEYDEMYQRIRKELMEELGIEEQ